MGEIPLCVAHPFTFYKINKKYGKVKGFCESNDLLQV